MIEKKYCKQCKVLISQGIMAFLNKTKVYEFEDGIYCEKCAKIMVDHRRKLK